MRHSKRRTRFGKMDNHRNFILASLAKHLFQYQEIQTTKVRAKEARRLAEKLITLAKKNDLSARRKVIGILNDKEIVKKLFTKIAPLFASRQGGYTRIIPLATRRGDGAELVILQLTEKLKEEKPAKKTKVKKTKVEEGKVKAGTQQDEKHKSAPEITKELREERTVEAEKKDKFMKEDRRASDDEKQGFLKKFFRRKQGM